MEECGKATDVSPLCIPDILVETEVQGQPLFVYWWCNFSPHSTKASRLLGPHAHSSIELPHSHIARCAEVTTLV